MASLVRTIASAFWLATICPLATAEDIEEPLTKAETTELVNSFCDCAGFYAASVALFSQMPASAENLRGLARGARMSALLLLAQEYAESHSMAKPLKAFETYTDGRIETSKTRALSLLETQDEEAFQLELEKCKALSQLQKELVQEMRDSAVSR